MHNSILKVYEEAYNFEHCHAQLLPKTQCLAVHRSCSRPPEVANENLDPSSVSLAERTYSIVLGVIPARKVKLDKILLVPRRACFRYRMPQACLTGAQKLYASSGGYLWKK